jgi:toxin FitB
VPTISIYEVFKVVLRERGDDAALRAMTLMQQGKVIDLSTTLALAAAQVSLTHGIPMADSIMLATARAHDATLWTQDADFRGLLNVKYVERKSG